MCTYTFQEVADELGVPVQDVSTVAQIELIEPEEYDSELETLSTEGRDRIITHFHGGTDPV